MAERTCPGLPADWLNAWLAAVGATVLNEHLQLRWSTDAVPVAVLVAPGGDDPVEALAESWPNIDRLNRMPIAHQSSSIHKMERKVPVEVFADRARIHRRHSDAWTLSSTMTDLHIYAGGEVAHAQLDPPGPGSIKWLHHRLLKAHNHVDRPAQQIAATLQGHGERVQANGLGFDPTRLTAQADKTPKTVDPVIEVLAFFGLAILPVRGAGADLRNTGEQAPHPARQRGWQTNPRRRFDWPAWQQPLDVASIDALIDLWGATRHPAGPATTTGARLDRNPKTSERLGIHAAWRTIRYEPRGTSDPTVAYGSQRL